MTFLPIVARELRVASRRPGTFWWRTGTAFVAVLVSVVTYWIVREEPPHERGADLFTTLCWLAYLYCVTAGLRSTTDCLSEEKREGTLGLLFLTDLKGYDVVGGKLVASSVNSFFEFIAIFPVLAVPLLMGGVTNPECVRGVLVLMNVFLGSLAVGMLMSSLFTSPRKSWTATLIALLVLTLGLPACVEWVPFINGSAKCTYYVQLFCPDTCMGLIHESEFRAAPDDFWWSSGVIFGMSCLCLLTASIIVPRSWQDHPSGVKAARLRDTWRLWRYGDEQERRAYRKRLLDRNAFFWLAARSRLQPALVWVALTVAAALWSWGAVEEGRSWLDGPTYIFTAVALNIMFKVWVASQSGRRLGEDRKSGALELLLSTPLGVDEIVRGQFFALTRQFLGPLLVSIAGQATLLLSSMGHMRYESDEVASELSFMVVYTVMLVADLAAISCVGMWAGLSAKNPLRATGVAVREILVLPWVIILAVMIVTLMTRMGWLEQHMTWRSFLVFYSVTGLGVDLWFGGQAWVKLHSQFRQVAAQRFVARPRFWKRLGLRRTQGETTR